VRPATAQSVQRPGYGMDGLGFEFCQGKQILSSLTRPERPRGQPNLTCNGCWVFPAGYEVGRSPPSNSGPKNKRNYTSTPHTLSWRGHGQLDLLYFNTHLTFWVRISNPGQAPSYDVSRRFLQTRHSISSIVGLPQTTSHLVTGSRVAQPIW